MYRRALLVFIFLALVGAAINVPVALVGAPGLDAVNPPVSVNVIGAGAAEHGWPATPPSAWPPVTQWSEETVGPYRNSHAWSRNASRTTTHQMEVEFHGWPAPALRQVRTWGTPDHSPRFKPPENSRDGLPGASGMSAGPGTGTTYLDSGLTLYWPGLVLNPLLFATVLWLPFVGPVLLWAAARRSLRRRRGRCLACGYPRGGSDACTECGVSFGA